MTKKDTNIVTISAAVIFITNLIIVFALFDFTTLETIMMFLKNVVLSLYLGLSIFATYFLSKEKNTKLIFAGVLFTIVVTFFDLSWMTYFNFKTINRLFCISFIVLALYIIILYISKNIKVKK